MFLLVSVRHVGAHPGGHQHDISIQISLNFGKTLRISRVRNILLVFVYLPHFIFQIPDFTYWTVLIMFYFDLFWMAWHWKPAIERDLASETVTNETTTAWIGLATHHKERFSNHMKSFRHAEPKKRDGTVQTCVDSKMPILSREVECTQEL